MKTHIDKKELPKHPITNAPMENEAEWKDAHGSWLPVKQNEKTGKWEVNRAVVSKHRDPNTGELIDGEKIEAAAKPAQPEPLTAGDQP